MVLGADGGETDAWYRDTRAGFSDSSRRLVRRSASCLSILDRDTRLTTSSVEPGRRFVSVVRQSGLAEGCQHERIRECGRADPVLLMLSANTGLEAALLMHL